MSESRLKEISETAAFKRLRYFDGKLLTAADFQLEQDYFRQKSKLHNRSLHGFGIISGLKVTVTKGQVIVEPGLALDCEGNELVIPTAQAIAPPATTGDCPTAFVSVRFVEEGVLVTAAQEGGSAIVTEGFEVVIAPENCNRGHRHLRARWLACGQPHALTIAKLKRSAHGWRVERGYRPPSIK
jgi:hypothetical protein